MIFSTTGELVQTPSTVVCAPLALEKIDYENHPRGCHSLPCVIPAYLVLFNSPWYLVRYYREPYVWCVPPLHWRKSTTKIIPGGVSLFALRDTSIPGTI